MTHRLISRDVRRPWIAMSALKGGKRKMAKMIVLDTGYSEQKIVDAIETGFGDKTTEKIISDWVESRKRRDDSDIEEPVKLR